MSLLLADQGGGGGVDASGTGEPSQLTIVSISAVAVGTSNGYATGEVASVTITCPSASAQGNEDLPGPYGWLWHAPKLRKHKEEDEAFLLSVLL